MTRAIHPRGGKPNITPVTRGPTKSELPASSSLPQAVTAQTSGRVGRPTVHTEPWDKITTLLMRRQVVYLDGLANEIRARDGKAIRRSDILQTLVDALANSGLDLSSVRSKDELLTLLLRRLEGSACP